MRKFYEEYFHIPEHGKIREKVMLTRVALTVATMVLCLIAMSITAYAYFSHEASSGTHVIKAANFATKVSIQVQGSDESPNVITSNYATHKVALDAGKTYTVTIEPLNTDTAANTGFVIVKADGCKEVYHTQQLYKPQAKSAEGKDTVLRFRLEVTVDTFVQFESHWGTSVHYARYQDKGVNDSLYIIQDETIVMDIDRGGKDTDAQQVDSTTTTTTTTTTVTTTTTSTTTTTTATTTTTTTEAVGEESTTPSSAATTETTTVPTQPDATPTEAPAPEDTEE